MSVSPRIHSFFRGKPSRAFVEFGSGLWATDCSRTSVLSHRDLVPVVWKNLQVTSCAPLFSETSCQQQNPPRLDAKAFLKPAGHLFLPVTREKRMEGRRL